jgi:hypothetical protein
LPGDRLTTDNLLQRLFKTASLDRFLRRYDDDLNRIPPFNEYLANIVRDKGAVPEQVIKKADIVRTYGHQLFNGTRKPTRDRAIQLAFGFGLSYEETQRLLKVARKSALYPKIKRDAIIIFALRNDYDIVAVQAALFELGIPILGEER